MSVNWEQAAKAPFDFLDQSSDLALLEQWMVRLDPSWKYDFSGPGGGFAARPQEMRAIKQHFRTLRGQLAARKEAARSVAGSDSSSSEIQVQWRAWNYFNESR